MQQGSRRIWLVVSPRGQQPSADDSAHQDAVNRWVHAGCSDALPPRRAPPRPSRCAGATRLRHARLCCGAARPGWAPQAVVIALPAAWVPGSSTLADVNPNARRPRRPAPERLQATSPGGRGSWSDARATSRVGWAREAFGSPARCGGQPPPPPNRTDPMDSVQHIFDQVHFFAQLDVAIVVVVVIVVFVLIT